MYLETTSPSGYASRFALRLGTNRSSKVLLLAIPAAQLAHLAVLLLLVHPKNASNLLQLLIGGLSAAVCLHQAARAESKVDRRLWLQLLLGFCTWTSAQLLFTLSLFGIFPTTASLISNTLWLFFAFPLVLAASTGARSSQRDAVGWLDTAQAFLFFGVLYALVFPRPGIITLELAYQVQSLAMLLAVLLSYSTARSGSKPELSRPLSIFVITYAVFSIGGYTGWIHGHPPGSLIDLCWTAPFSIFSISVLLEDSRGALCLQPLPARRSSPGHLRGVSALGLAAMSLVAAGALAMHRTILGSLAVVTGFLLFAARTSIREGQLQSAHQEQEFAALHDPLTKLANRTLLEQELNSRLKREARTPVRVALIFIDLDRFKTINDGLSHAFGDRLLFRVAELLIKAVRSEDLVGRHGGDEFAILFDHQDESEAESFSRHINEILREPIQLDDRLVHVTASIGLVLQRQAATAESMFQDADCAMNKAKGLGKDRAQTFAPNMLLAARRRLSLETDLRASLAAHAVEVHYQPIYALRGGVAGGSLGDCDSYSGLFALPVDRSLDQGRDPGLGHEPGQSRALGQDARSGLLDTVQGFEALARWRHPQRGMISPGDFIPVAEDTGLIIELGRQVLLQACHQCRAWNQRFGTRLTISVNVSALQFARPGLLDQIKTTLRVTGLDPCLLKLEVTESVLLNGYHAAEEVLGGARAMGIGVCLDDFGTGYSSLSYLLRFPFDIVKIDRSFVRHLDSDHRRAEMVRMLIQMAAMLKKKIVAEGIESPAELARLRALGCEMVQGFLLSRPLTPAGVEQLLGAEPAALADAQERGVNAGSHPLPQGNSVVEEPGALLAGNRLAHSALLDRPAYVP